MRTKRRRPSPLLDALSERGVFRDAPVVGIDAGCRGGLPREWRRFSPALVAHGVDPLIAECQRLQAAETLPTVRYHARFLGIPSEFQAADNESSRDIREAWARLSTARVLEHLAASGDKDVGAPRAMADPSSCISIDDLASEQGLDCVDVLKIDVDGLDYQVLRSATGLLPNVLWLKIEVNFVGSTAPEANTLRNIDGFLRDRGFALFGLNVHLYSRAALPAPFAAHSPALTISGAPLQGHAWYGRDPAAHSGDLRLSVVQLAKLAALFELHGLSDCAAELLVVFGDRWRAIADPSVLLDALASAVVPGMSYTAYMEAFHKTPLAFPPPPEPAPPLFEVRRQVENAPRRKSTMKGEQDELARANAALRKANGVLEDGLLACQQATVEATRRAERLHGRLEAIESSVTWRAMAPWRHIRQALTGLRRGRSTAGAP